MKTVNQTKVCSVRSGRGCGKEKLLSEFQFIKKKNIYTGLCRECLNADKKQWRWDNPERAQNNAKRDRNVHKEARAKYNKKYRAEHADESREYQRDYAKKRRKEDINYRIAGNLRSRIKYALNNNQKVGSAVDDLGFSISELTARLASLFYIRITTREVMTLENHGEHGWHIDHIIPLVFFDLEDRNHFLVGCNYLNLQPLWEEDNKTKHHTLPLNFDTILVDIVNNIPEIQNKIVLIDQLMQRKQEYIKGEIK